MMKNYTTPWIKMVAVRGTDVILASQLQAEFSKPSDFDGGDPSTGSW